MIRVYHHIWDLGFDTSGVLIGIPHWSQKIYGGNFWWTTVKF